MILYAINKIIPVPCDGITLEGELKIPKNCRSLVIFSHGSGSSRLSTRNNFVAKELHKKNIGTFLFDLLTKEEDENYENRFNISLLTQRLIDTTKFLSSLDECKKLKLGYFGASTGATSAMIAATKLPKIIAAFVSRGGRTDLAMEVAYKLNAPTLLIVGELDYDVLNANRKVYETLTCVKQLEIIPDATHLFGEPGALNQVAEYAANWFEKHLILKKENILI